MISPIGGLPPTGPVGPMGSSDSPEQHAKQDAINEIKGLQTDLQALAKDPRNAQLRSNVQTDLGNLKSTMNNAPPDTFTQQEMNLKKDLSVAVNVFIKSPNKDPTDALSLSGKLLDQIQPS